jgi:hypothetical protein
LNKKLIRFKAQHLKTIWLRVLKGEKEKWRERGIFKLSTFLFFELGGKKLSKNN